jgi:hypothetical protein
MPMETAAGGGNMAGPKEFLCSIDGLGMGKALCVRKRCFETRTDGFTHYHYHVLIIIIIIISIIMRNTYRAVRLFVMLFRAASNLFRWSPAVDDWGAGMLRSAPLDQANIPAE